MIRTRFARTTLTVLLLTLSAAACTDTDAPPERRPNVLLIVADDLGYTDLGVFGGEIGTPHLDALAREGVLLTNFHAAATCSPTRAMLMSGTDPHLAGLGTMAHDQTPSQLGQPGYEGYLNFRVAALPALLRDAGYHTYMTGKWHLGLDEETSPAARGFERSFGVMNGGAGHFDALPLFASGRTVIREDGQEVELPADFYSTRDYTDRMIEYIDAGRGDGRPFFAYLAYTAPHWPLQAPAESIARFAGRYDEGWDVLHERRVAALKRLGFVPQDAAAWPGLPGRRPWDRLTDDERRIEARKMEIFAAMVRDLDHYVGKILRHLEEIGELENTFVMFLSDNGAEGHDLQSVWPSLVDHIRACCDNSYENMGRANSYLDYGPDWARAGVGVGRMYKGFSTEGGIRVPAFVRWPGLGSAPAVRHDLASAVDVAPTILELAGVEHPGTQYGDRQILPLQGRSLLPLLRGELAQDAPPRFLGWELFDRRAVRLGSWKLTYTAPPHGSGTWELFDLDTDPAELHDLSDTWPEKRQELLARWDAYVRENGVVLPDEPSDY